MSDERLQSLRKQLAMKQDHLHLIEERKNEYVDAKSIPLDLIANERRIKAQIADLQSQVQQVDTSDMPPTPRAEGHAAPRPAATESSDVYNIYIQHSKGIAIGHQARSDQTQTFGAVTTNSTATSNNHEQAPLKPAAFMSYSRFDDEYSDGAISKLGERLRAEMRFQTGADFVVFQEKHDIAWGEHGPARIKEELNSVSFLIPILTPNFFTTPACQEELRQFAERERTLGRSDLILPIYYVDYPPLNSQSHHDPHINYLIQLVAARQPIDWRDMRFESFSSSRVRRMLARMAEQIAAALRQQ